ncbi:hypothetical protein GH714_007288 [Hevea brasiliensis]|uniref:SCP domain-containing protein n=1 Tax=Hevea brasiliensis TaxID=3981 RepID=A0A6A6KZR4_HEVBR|nr:hypothetical protein GH714_007288 [Hevea brasiliensis]
MMKKLLFLILIVAGSISSCTLGVEVERFAWGKGRKEKIACQLITKAHPKRSSYLACEDAKRNHMNMLGKYSKYENLLPGSEQAVDANLRYNRMPRLANLHISQKLTKPTNFTASARKSVLLLDMVEYAVGRKKSCYLGMMLGYTAGCMQPFCDLGL